MNRKNTILIAVMINAGLLAILLVAAITTQEETISPSTLMGDSSNVRMEDKPLFGDVADLSLRTPVAPPAEIVLPESPKVVEAPPPISLPSVPVVQEPLVHKLPPLVQEPAPVASAPAPAESPSSEVAFVEVTVKKGDSLEKIAKIHHTSVDEIIKVNHLPSTFLRIGQILKVPTQKSLSLLPKLTAPEKKVADAGPEYYTVKVGDNPWTIAMKHQMKVEELLRLNGLNEERARKLKPGDRLRTR
jgi:LysM repeat protein